MVGKRKSVVETRSVSEKRFCGQPLPLAKTEPPTVRQVIQYSYFIQKSRPDLKDYDIAKLIAKDVLEIWHSVNPRLPLYNEYYIIKMINKVCFKKAKMINRKHLSSAKTEHLYQQLDKLLDISACTCQLPIVPCEDKFIKCTIENCQQKHIACMCPLQKKVPLEEREYLKDQRAKIGPRGFFQLGSVDTTAVRRERNAACKAQRLQNQIEKHIASTSSQQFVEHSNMPYDSEEEYQPDGQLTGSGPYSLLKTPCFAMELIRGDISSRVGASLANALLIDLQSMGLLKDGFDLKQIILDKSKIDREKSRVKVQGEDKKKSTLLCIGVDGKVDRDTMMYKEITDGNGERKLMKGRGPEHHLTFTNESGTESGSYLTHRVVPTVGATGVVLGKEVASVLKIFDSVNTIKAILLDNTSTNTGSASGLVTVTEKEIGKHLHTIGCSLHQNELPFRASFRYLDGNSKSPTGFSAPLGRLCEKDNENLPQVEFDKLSGPLDSSTFSEC